MIYNTRSIFILSSLFIICLCCTSLVHAQTKNDSIAVYLKAEMKKRQIPGLQVAVIYKGRVEMLQAYGIANLEFNIPVTNNTLFSINSCTKSFTGVVLMQLVENGKLKLTDPVSFYLDDLPDNWKKVTVYQLVTHTSGLPDIVDMIGKLSYEEAWQKVQTMPLQFPAGEKKSYNQTNYVLLGKIIEKLSGKEFTQFIADGQFKPAGMLNTVFGDDHQVIPNKAPSYALSQKSGDGLIKGKTPEHVFEEFPGLLRAGAGINSTAQDLANWIMALQKGQLFKHKNTLENMWIPGKINNGEYSGWAVGWQTINRFGHRAVAGIGGSRSWFYIYPDDDLAVIVLTNLRGTMPENMAREVAGFYFPVLQSAQGADLPDSVIPVFNEIKKRGYNQAITITDQLRSKNAGFNISEHDMTNWAYFMLMVNEQPAEALELFKLLVHLYPKSTDSWDSLGEGSEAAGDKKNAAIAYKQALQLDTTNKHAMERLKVLGAD